MYFRSQCIIPLIDDLVIFTIDDF